jgi:hypothetical protein
LAGWLAQEAFTMADDKSNAGGRDRATVAGDELYEVQYFADKHGITTAKARKLIDKFGNNRAELDKAARNLKGR